MSCNCQENKAFTLSIEESLKKVLSEATPAAQKPAAAYTVSDETARLLSGLVASLEEMRQKSEMASRIVSAMEPIGLTLDAKIDLGNRLLEAIYQGQPSFTPGCVFMSCGVCLAGGIKFCQCWPSGRYVFVKC